MTTAAILSAALAGLAVLLVWPDPAHRLQRVSPSSSRSGLTARADAVRLPAEAVGRLLRGRPGAPPMPSRLGLSAAAASAVCVAANSSLGTVVWWCWPLLVAAGVLVTGWLEPSAVRRRTQRLVQEAPQALELMAACLAAGAPPRNACAAVVAVFDGPVGEDLHQVLNAVRLGVPESEAWLLLATHPQLGPAAQDLSRSVDSGTRMAEALRVHADVARERRRAALQQAARAVGVRSVLPLMICFLPAFLLLGVVPTVVSAIAQAFG